MRRALLRCYPRRWRARYGEEFAALLEERSLGPFDVIDVLLGALDAHLHLRGLGAAAVATLVLVPTMTGSISIVPEAVASIAFVVVLLGFTIGWAGLGASALALDRRAPGTGAALP